LVLELRSKGKRVVFFAHHYNTAMYYLASAGDQIVMQPGGTLDTLGLSRRVTYFRDALAAVGLQVDAVAISPYKSFADPFTAKDMTPEVRAQTEWLLDSTYDILVEGIARARGMASEAVRAMVDNAPPPGPRSARTGVS
ncbi:MAG: signal peptide peptidase SppA, partial [Anaerolineae bacterium]|nr:signal peptide peptidase SppA [Anaerolineae bacterium]